MDSIENSSRRRPAPKIADLTEATNERARALVAYWHASHGTDGALPDRAAFDPTHLLPWVGHISIYRTVSGGKDFRVTLDGTEIVEMTGEDWTGRLTSEIDRTYGVDLTGLMRSIMATGQPCIQQISLVQKEWTPATRISLPVSRGDETGAGDIFMAIFLD